MKFNYLLISIFAFGLTSCASHCEVPPNDVSHAPSSYIQNCNGLTGLEEGGACSISVSAKEGADTWLYARTGEEYRIEMPENQVWYDCTIRVSSLCGVPGTSEMNRVSFLKKESDSDWFSAIAEIKDDNNTIYDLCELSEKPHNSAIIIVNHPGNISLYPNDAYFFYGNNSGIVWLIIHRLK